MTSLIGEIRIDGEVFVLIKYCFKKNSQAYILLHTTVEGSFTPRYQDFYRSGGRLDDPAWVAGILDTFQNKSYGSTVLLESLLEEITSQKITSLKKGDIRKKAGTEIYDADGNILRYVGGELLEVDLKTESMEVNLSVPSMRLNLAVRKLDSLLAAKTHIERKHTKFLDRSLEALENIGFDLDWFLRTQYVGLEKPGKQYTAIHNMEQFDSIVLPDFEKAIMRAREMRARGTEEYFTIDFESNGLDAWSENSDNRSKTVFLGMSWEDHKAFGVCIGMKHFENVDNALLAERLTNMFSHDLLIDREITLPSGFKYKRSEIRTTAHNMNIDIRFGMVLGADIWINYDSMQIGFNLDPFLTQGKNGAKFRVKQHSGVVYPDLEDIGGKGIFDKFAEISDLRVALMYGCADVDEVRMMTRSMIENLQSPEVVEYLQGNQIEMWKKFDEEYMNMVARNEYYGVRVNKEEGLVKYQENQRILDIYKSHMDLYYSKVVAMNHFLDVLRALKVAGNEKETVIFPDLNKVELIDIEAWNGGFLLTALFEVMRYPILVFTKSKKKVKPSTDNEAVKVYLKEKRDFEEEAKSAHDPLVKFFREATELKEDIIDPLNNKVLISAKEFNSLKYPFFLFLQKIARFTKQNTGDLKKFSTMNSPYRFEPTKTNSIVTRRVVSGLCTVSKSSKEYYIPYTEDYNILNADQASVEIKIAWMLSRDLSLIEPLIDPEKDPHTEACAEFFSKPAYLVDRKTERGPIKGINFGRIYLMEVWKTCHKIFDGEMTSENLAKTAYLLELFDRARAPVHAALNQYRDESIIPKDPPEWIKWFLLMVDEETDEDGSVHKVSWGYMQNEFKWVQHIKMRDDDESWYRERQRRRAGNFGVQGFASTLLRIIYQRLMRAAWARGWIQDGKFILHATVYDEILASYHKDVDPIELITVLSDAFIVKYRHKDVYSPPFYIGINITNTWGDAKDDKYEIPIHLLNQFKAEYNDTSLRENSPINYQDLTRENHVEWFLANNEAYTLRRISHELQLLNPNFAVWDIADLSEKFENYHVRMLLLGLKNLLFPIKDFNDPIEVLCSTVVPFVLQYLLKENDSTIIFYRGKRIKMTHRIRNMKFSSEKDFIILNPIKEDDVSVKADYDVENEKMSFEIDDLFGEVDFDEDDLFVDAENPEVTESIGQESLNYLARELLSRMGQTPKSQGEQKSSLPSYTNFTFKADKVFVDADGPKEIQEKLRLLSKYNSTSTTAVPVFIRGKGSFLKSVTRMTHEQLAQLDAELSS